MRYAVVHSGVTDRLHAMLPLNSTYSSNIRLFFRRVARRHRGCNSYPKSVLLVYLAGMWFVWWGRYGIDVLSISVVSVYR